MALKSEFFFCSSDSKHKLRAFSWHPEQRSPKAVVQIAHGLLEHIERYDNFARFIADSGYLVTANDHLGHGGSFTDEKDYGFFADKNGWDYVVEDMHNLFEITHKQYPQLPYFLLGHSMGSFLSRTYLSIHPGELSGCILSGTGDQNPVICKLGSIMAKMQFRHIGAHGRSQMINNLAFGSYNKRISSCRTRSDWLTKDTAIVDQYINDPKCGGIPTLSLFLDMFKGFIFIGNKKNIINIGSTMPIYLIAGREDPVGNYGKSVEKLYNKLIGLSFSDVTMKLYDNDRHEVLNELDRDSVYKDILNWLEKRVNID